MTAATAMPDFTFRSVFPPKTHTTPTPEATPNIGTLASPGVAFGGFNLPPSPIDAVTKQNRAWSTVTRFLTLTPDLEPRSKNLLQSPDVHQSLIYLLSSYASQKNLTDWYLHELSMHFRHFVLPELQAWQQPVADEGIATLLSKTVPILRQAQQKYLVISPPGDYNSDAFTSRIRHGFHELVLHSLPRQRTQQVLASHFYNAMRSGLSQSSNPEKCLKRHRCVCQLGLDFHALAELHEVGLGGANGERAFALAVHKLLQSEGVERRCFQVDWTNKKSVVARLRMWIEEIFAPSAQQVVAALTGRTIDWRQAIFLSVNELTSMAVTKFGRSRICALFDYVSSWPASEGAVLDVREHLNASDTGEKAYLCTVFSEQLRWRLLHAGASTTEILSVYVNIINVFQLLDSRGVLLEKVAQPIRAYLRLREDTSTVIATSLLAEVDENGEVQAHDQDKVCADISVAVSRSAIDAQDDRLLNWNDMNWVPDPIDAGPNYKSSKSDDVVSYILGLFDPDDFIKALSAAFGDHLIRTTETELSKETRLVELMKSRLDSSKLQSVEVMLKDVRDSTQLNRRINPEQHRPRHRPKPTPKEIQTSIPEEGITVVSLYDQFKDRMERAEFLAVLSTVARKHQDLYFAKRTRVPPDPPEAEPVSDMHFEAKVLSNYFWPQLRDVDFRVPQQAHSFMAKYETAFSNISGQRKLEWKHGLGTTDITLQLDDRTVDEHGIEIWKTSIIDVFASRGAEDGDAHPIQYDENVGLSVAELMEILSMEEDYVLSGISFWLGNRVLYEISQGRYAVLERLDMEIEYAQDASQLDIETISAIKSEDAMLLENAPMYQIFIDGMLRNQGAKEIEGMMGITNMLKMVMPSFTGGDGEVQWLLEDMESKGKVKRSGELWAVV